MDERHVEENRNDYNRFDKYNESHPDALATGDAQGKGTGSSQGNWSLPHFSPTPKPIDYSRFDTENSPSRAVTNTNPGNGSDNEWRNSMVGRSIYGPDNQYCPGGRFESYNLYEGQYWAYDRPLNDSPASQIPAENSGNTGGNSGPVYFGRRPGGGTSATNYNPPANTNTGPQSGTR